ncbi:MAG: hypothetical protein LBS10_05795 [Gracilibacteraceae bacterium]|nr:hypothetical protein [Gracilibacteraceae bacterium]
MKFHSQRIHRRRRVALLTAILLFIGLFAVLTVPVLATPGAYTVTFAVTNTTVQVNGSTTLTATSDSSGVLNFNTTPATNYAVSVASIAITPSSGTTDAVVLKTGPNAFQLQAVDQAVTLTIVADPPFTGQTTAGGYAINNETQLLALATAVNGSTDPIALPGYTFTLTDDIALSDPWTPIGGAGGVSGTVPSSNGFAGIFDGQDFTISELDLNPTITGSTNNTGYGLFGFVNGGTVGNLTVSGEIIIDDTSVAQDIGGVVGYTNGSLYNLTSDVTISVGKECSNVGGVVGAMENLTTPITARYLANVAQILAGGHVGGVIGGMYSGPGNLNTIDRCFNTAMVAGLQQSKTYVGGVVGYACAAITNTYNTGEILVAGGDNIKCYLGGITGILVHYSTPRSSLANSYSTSGFVGYMTDYAQYLYASADNDSTTPITNSYWVVPSAGALGYDQAVFGTHTDVSAQAASALTPTLLGSAFTGSAPATLDWSGAYTDLQTGTPTPPADTDDLNMIFLDGTATVNGTGTKGDPYNSLTSALGDLTATRPVVYILGKLTISATTNIDSSTLPIGNAVITRSCSYTGDLFDVTGGTLTLGDVTVHGNSANVANASGALVWIDGGSLVVGPGATLQKNDTQTNGGAIHIFNGDATLDGGQISSNEAKIGGAVYIDSDGVFTLKDGEVGNNIADRYAPGIYVTASGTVVLDPGNATTLSIAGGNPIYLPSGVSFNIDSSLGSLTNSVPVAFASPAKFDSVAFVANPSYIGASRAKLAAPQVTLDDDGDTEIYIDSVP